MTRWLRCRINKLRGNIPLVVLGVVAVIGWIIAIAAGYVETFTDESDFIRTLGNGGFYVGVVCASLVAAYVFFAGRGQGED